MRVFLAGLIFAFLCTQAVFAETGMFFALEVSRAANIGEFYPNRSGVLPVRLRWQRPAGAKEGGFHVYRSTRADLGFERISSAPVEIESGGFFFYIDDNPAAVPGKLYYYRVSLYGSEGNFSEIVMGYGALSPESFWLEYSRLAKSSYKKMVLMNKPGALSKLGSEQKQGNISGSLSYQARIAGLGGRVIMRYEQYSDFFIDNNISLGPYLVLTGNVNTSAAITMNGKMDGTVNVSGMYPGRIYYDKIQIRRGAPRGGTYGVEPEGFPRAELDWVVLDWIVADQ